MKKKEANCLLFLCALLNNSMEIHELEKLLVDALATVREMSNTSLFSLVNKPDWPLSVEPFLICDEFSETEKTERAESILDSIEERYLLGKKFLDFGCGEGHVAIKAKDICSFSVGYDLVQYGSLQWESEPLLTTNLDKVKNFGPYDFILICDVIDHTDEPINILREVYNLLTPGGFVYLRCHPWCSRHGSHQYKILNKAFVHLVFSEEELKKLNFIPEVKQKVIRPLATYAKWIEDSGFVVESMIKDTSKVENFFSDNDAIRNRLMQSMQLDQWTTFQLEHNFIDYILKKK